MGSATGNISFDLTSVMTRSESLFSPSLKLSPRWDYVRHALNAGARPGGQRWQNRSREQPASGEDGG